MPPERAELGQFDFRLSGIKGVEARGSTPVSKECGKSQPLRALCLSLSRYRRNRLFLLCSEGTANHTTPRSLRTRAVARSTPLLLLHLSLHSRHGTPVARSWRPHSRRHRCRRLRSPRRVVASPTRMKIETGVWTKAGKMPKARGGDEQRLGGAQATSQRSPFNEK